MTTTTNHRNLPLSGNFIKSEEASTTLLVSADHSVTKSIDKRQLLTAEDDLNDRDLSELRAKNVMIASQGRVANLRSSAVSRQNHQESYLEYGSGELGLDAGGKMRQLTLPVSHHHPSTFSTQ